MSNQAVPFVGGLIFFGILAGGFCAQVFVFGPQPSLQPSRTTMDHADSAVVPIDLLKHSA